MTEKKFRISRLKVAVLTCALALVVAVPALAADTVSQTVEGGDRTASIADLTLTNVTYSHSSQTNTGTMVLTADDSSGTDDGWNVTVQAGAFEDTTDATNTIAASNFELTTANAPTVSAGEAIDATGGPKVPDISPTGTLDTARKTVQADAGFGKGTYNQDLDVSLTIPEQTLAATYVSNLTVSITAGP